METVKVQGGEYGYYVINKDDFDHKVHTEYVEGEAVKAPPKSAKKA